MNLIEKLQAENEALKSKLKANEETISSLEKLNRWYMEQLKLRQQEKFGSSSEKAVENQLTLIDVFSDLFNEAEILREPIAVEPDVNTLIPEHKRKKAKRGAKFDSLPVETIEYTLTDEEKICDVCGSVLTEMKKEIRKELKIIPAQVKVVEHVTYVYSCRNCDKNVSNWTIKGADLLKPLMFEMKNELLSNELLHADETTLEVLKEPGRESTAKSYMWLYRTSECTKRPVVLYDYQIGRSGSHAMAFLKNWEGTYLHCDGYSGYKKLENVILCGCLVHAKRKFHEAWKVNQSNEEAKRGEVYIQKLFAIENKADQLGFDYEERLHLRKSESKVVLDEFYTWLENLALKTLPQSLLGKAITYAQNQKEYLCNFLKDGRIQLSNNLALYTGYFYPHLFRKVA